MSVRNRLLSMSLAGTAALAGVADGRVESKEIDTKIEAMEAPVNPLQLHFNKMCKNVRGSHAGLIKQAMCDIANTPHGADLLAEVPDNIPIFSKRNIEYGMSGHYHIQENEIAVGSDLIKSRDENRPLQVLLEHEMRHSAQDKRNLFMEGQKPSVEQLMTVSKLSEAETRAWDIVSGITYSQIHLDERGQPTNMKEFMDRKFDPKEEENESVFQKCVRNNKGNLKKAQIEMAGGLIKDAMSQNFNKDPAWRERYDAQSLRTVVAAALVENISEKGNKGAFNNALNYYKKTYGISRRHINEPNVEPQFEPLKEGLESFIKTRQMDTDVQRGLEKLIDPRGGGVSLSSNMINPPETPKMKGEAGLPHLPHHETSIPFLNLNNNNKGMG